MTDWTPSKTCPGYREKTIQKGAATIIIRRPILDGDEQVKRERAVQNVLSNALTDYIKRKEANHE
jgi:hypothetical protein